MWNLLIQVVDTAFKNIKACPKRKPLLHVLAELMMTAIIVKQMKSKINKAPNVTVTSSLANTYGISFYLISVSVFEFPVSRGPKH